MVDASGPRRNNRDDFSFPEFRSPEMNPQRYADMVRAANAYAANNASDPFAFGRIMCHMKRGIANPAEVYADARGIPILE